MYAITLYDEGRDLVVLLNTFETAARAQVAAEQLRHLVDCSGDSPLSIHVEGIGLGTPRGAWDHAAGYPD